MKARKLRRPALALMTVLSALLIAACGNDNNDGSAATKGNINEAAFLEAMIPHHRSAVEMAQMAREKGDHPEIKQLATSIIRAQNNEIAQMRRIYRRIFGRAIKPNADAHMKLGLSAEKAGMAHMDMAALEKAKPFDRTFIDEMIGHHQGAIRMARAVMPKAEDSEIKRLAGSIIQAQSGEIEYMNDWRRSWYGAESPTGGVPSAAGSDSPEAGADDAMQAH